MHYKGPGKWTGVIKFLMPGDWVAIVMLMPEGSEARFEFIVSTGQSPRMLVPKGRLPEMTLEWHISADWNAIERNRAQAYAEAYTALVALNNLLIGYELMKQGNTAVSLDFTVPRDFRIGVGFWGAGRGYLTHHLTMATGCSPTTRSSLCRPSMPPRVIRGDTHDRTRRQC